MSNIPNETGTVTPFSAYDQHPMRPLAVTLDLPAMTDAQVLAELKRLAFEAMHRLDKHPLTMTQAESDLYAVLEDVPLLATTVAMDRRSAAKDR